MKPSARNCASRSGPVTPASKVASWERGSSRMSRRSRVITMASDGLSPRPGVRWPTTLVAPPTGMAIAPIAPAQSSASLTSSSVSGKATPSTIGPRRPKRRRSQSSRLWPMLARRRVFRVPADQTMVRQPGRTDAGEDVGEGRIVRRRRLADAFTEEIPARVRAGAPRSSPRPSRSIVASPASKSRPSASSAFAPVGVKEAANFPARREFLAFRPKMAKSTQKPSMIPRDRAKIPCASTQGIFRRTAGNSQGISEPEQGTSGTPVEAGDRGAARLGQAPAGRVRAPAVDRRDSGTAGWRGDGDPCAQ